MLDKTKEVIKVEISKYFTFTDPAPMPGSETVSILKTLKEDVKEIVNKHKSGWKSKTKKH